MNTKLFLFTLIVNVLIFGVVSKTDCENYDELYDWIRFKPKSSCCGGPYSVCNGRVQGESSPKIKKIILENKGAKLVIIPKSPIESILGRTTKRTKTLPTSTLQKTTITSTTKTIPTSTITNDEDEYSEIFKCEAMFQCNTSSKEKDYSLPIIINEFKSLETLNITLSKDIWKVDRDYIYYYMRVNKLPKLDGLISLKQLYIEDGALTELPTGLENTKIEELNLYSNKISGYLPESFGNLKYLKEIDLSENDELFGYPLKNVEKCNYKNTKICYPEGFTGCKTNAKKCTEEEIQAIEEQRKKSCWAISLGYSCCNAEESKVTYLSDSDGDWGINANNEWCGIIRDSTTEMQCQAQKYGYKCCQDENSFVMEDTQGKWGVENNEWCGIN